jgi:hypothetical protein
LKYHSLRIKRTKQKFDKVLRSKGLHLLSVEPGIQNIPLTQHTGTKPASLESSSNLVIPHITLTDAMRKLKSFPSEDNLIS